jgi:hypothetical protein
VPPRPRSISVDHKRIASVNSAIKKNSLDLSGMELPSKDSDIANADCNYFLFLCYLNFVLIEINVYSFFCYKFSMLFELLSTVLLMIFLLFSQ